MSELYKYKTISEYTIYSLINKYLYFSCPKELDDIFECKIAPDFKHTTQSEIQAWLTQYKGRGTFPYTTVNDVTAAIKNGELYNHYLNNPDNIDKYHILSLCKERDNQKLWSLYANTYNGICIGYHVEEMKYSDGAIIPDTMGLLIIDPHETYKNSHFNFIGKIEYNSPFATVELTKTLYINEGQFSYDWITEKMYDNSVNPSLKYDGKNKPSDRKEIYQLILNSKSKYWNDQNEYRGFYHENGTPESKIYYPDETLSSITFGYKLDNNKKKEIYNLVTSVYSSSIKFEIAEPDYSTRKIKFTKYTP